jgi:hypothetical protein
MIKKLDEINAMIDRGGKHFAWLEDFVRHHDGRVIPNEPDVHVLEESFDVIVTNIRIRIGECANSFRNALNYMTCAIAEQDSGHIGYAVQFPIEDSTQRFWNRRDTYLEGIRDERIATFEKFQPYNAGDWLKDLRSLSNFYKHKGLIVVDKQVDQIERLAPTSRTKSGLRVITRQMHVNRPAIRVAFPDGRPIIQTLDVVHHGVCDIIDEFNPFIRNIGI